MGRDAARMCQAGWQKLSAGVGAKGHRFYDGADFEPVEPPAPQVISC